MKKIMIIANEYKENIVSYINDLKNYLVEKKIEVVSEREAPELMIVAGGDGTLIKASKIASDLDIPVMAVNMGSLGFLTDIKQEEIFNMIEEYIEGNSEIEVRCFLEISVDGVQYHALNEVVVAKGGVLSRMIRIKLFANDLLVNNYRADGIIVATPTGSTAYNLSAGGPIMKPDVKAIVVTPIAPHTLSARPIVLDGNDRVVMEMSEEHNDTFATIDGQISIKLENTSKVEVCVAKKSLKLIKPKNRDYYSILREKLNWGEEYAKLIKH